MLIFKSVLLSLLNPIIKKATERTINIKAALGADPITVFYEGLSKFLHTNLGMTINVLNAVLTLIIFFIERKYIHIGTLIYVLSLGTFVNFGTWVYDMLCIPNTFIARLIISIFGCTRYKKHHTTQKQA